MSYIYDGKTKLVFKNKLVVDLKVENRDILKNQQKNKEINKLKTRLMIERLAFGFVLMFISLFVLVAYTYADIIGMSFCILFCGSLSGVTIILLNLIDFVAKEC